MDAIALVLLACLVIGYAFAECGRYLAANRRPNPPLPYPVTRLRGRLAMAAALGELALVAFRLYVWTGELPVGAALAYLGVTCALLLVLFGLVAADLRETRAAIRRARGALHDDLRRELDALLRRNAS